MRISNFARMLALLLLAVVFSGCPKKDTDAVPTPEPGAAAPSPASDRAGSESPAAPATPPPAAKKEDDKGGW